MIESPHALYKLIVLFALNKVESPLTNTQLLDLFQKMHYTSYFHLQEVLSDLESDRLISADRKHRTTYYVLTDEGLRTHNLFSGEIPPGIRDEVTAYLLSNGRELRREAGVISDYSRTSAQDYTVHCTAKEGELTLIDLKLSVPTEAAASALAESWRTRSQEAYQALIQALLSEK